MKIFSDGKYGKTECETIEFVSEDVIGFGKNWRKLSSLSD